MSLKATFRACRSVACLALVLWLPYAAHASQYDQELLDLTNAKRASQGVAPLRLSTQLGTAAQQHAEDMAQKNYFDHHSLDGRSPFDRIAATGYQYSTAGENIAAGNDTPAGTIDQWMNSSGHRANILNANYTEIGFGYAQNSRSDYQHYWVQVFGTPAGGSSSNTTTTNTSTSNSGGFQITPELWINARINSVEKGLINALWKAGGSATTARGDKVTWGLFYANPTDVTWGSEQNPDLFVKIWFDVSGRVDVNYFHVSVPDLLVYSSKNGGETLSGTTTLSTRYVRHYFNADKTQGVATEITQEILRNRNYGQPTATTQISAVPSTRINTVEKGLINGQLFNGGTAYTARGDFVYWGYAYADPAQVSWGSSNNPEVFFKIWRDAPSGRYDVNFFHVSVPNIEVNSSLAKSSTNTQVLTFIDATQSSSTVTLDQRYARHEYHLQ